MTIDDDDLIPLGEALTRIRFGLITVEPISEERKAAAMTKQHELVERTAKARARATLSKVAETLRAQAERSEARLVVLRELDADDATVAAEREVLAMLRADLVQAEDIVEEYA